MITELTKKQESEIIPTREKWLSYFWNSKKKSKKEITRYIEKLYEDCGFNKPVVWFVDSPYMAQIMANYLLNENWHDIDDDIVDNILNKIWDNICSDIGGNIDKNIKYDIGKNIRKNIMENIRDNIWDNIWQNIRENVRENIGQNIVENIWKKIIQSMKYYSYGHYGGVYDILFLAYYDYFISQNLIKVDSETLARLSTLSDIAKSGVYNTIQMDGLCIVSMMPDTMKWVDTSGEKRLHCEDGPAIGWNDGYALYALFGVFFDKELFEKVTSGKITFSEVMKIDNIEQRYAAIRLLEPNKMIRDSGAKLIHTGKKITCGEFPSINKLYEVVIDEIRCVFVKYNCNSTGRQYFSFVPPEMSDADEAMAWKHNLTIGEYMFMKVEA